MSIRTISTGQLRHMGDQEGLVLQGCGGDPQEWVDGINEILAQEGILKKGAGFEEAYTFRHDGLTCMLFPFKEDAGFLKPVAGLRCRHTPCPAFCAHRATPEISGSK